MIIVIKRFDLSAAWHLRSGRTTITRVSQAKGSKRFTCIDSKEKIGKFAALTQTRSHDTGLEVNSPSRLTEKKFSFA